MTIFSFLSLLSLWYCWLRSISSRPRLHLEEAISTAFPLLVWAFIQDMDLVAMEVDTEADITEVDLDLEVVLEEDAEDQVEDL